MAAPAYRSGTTAGDTTGTNLTINVPAGVANNDLLFVVLYREGGSWTMPGGWTQLYDVPSANAGQTTTVAWRRASSEPASYTFNLSASVWRIGTMVALSGGIASGSPVDVSTSAADNNSSVVAPSMTTVTADTMLLWLTANFTGADVTVGTSGMAQGAQLGGCEVWYVTQASAGATGTKTFGNSGMGAGDWVGVFLAIKPATGGTAYTQSVAGGVGASGALPRRAGKALAGGAAFSGAIAKRAGKGLAGGTASSGALTKRIGKALAGGMASSGALTTVRVILKALAGGLANAGTLVKRTARTLTGGAAASGSLAKSTGKSLAGALAGSGALGTVRVIIKALTGGLAASGAIANRTGKALAGAAANAGTLTKRTARSLAGALASSGALSTIRVVIKLLSGGLDAAGSILRRTTHALAGNAGASGVLVKRASHMLAGSLGGSGALGIARQFARALAGGLAAAGTLTKRTGHGLAGGLGVAGSIAKTIGKVLAGTVSAAGSAAQTFISGQAPLVLECLTANVVIGAYSTTIVQGFSARVVSDGYTGERNDCE